MSQRETKFNVTREEDAFLIGRLGDEPTSGTFLTPEYLSRLQEVLSAAKIRINFDEAPDAIKNLFGILHRLLDAHSSQTQMEPRTSGKTVDYLAAQEELRKAMENLLGGEDGPKKA
jgi:hypothetical protein